MAETDKLWHVSINNTQRTYIIEATDAATAAQAGGDLWRADDTLTKKQRDRGIYDARVRAAKFGQVRSQGVLSVVLGDDGKFRVAT